MLTVLLIQAYLIKLWTQHSPQHARAPECGSVFPIVHWKFFRNSTSRVCFNLWRVFHSQTLCKETLKEASIGVNCTFKNYCSVQNCSGNVLNTQNWSDLKLKGSSPLSQIDNKFMKPKLADMSLDSKFQAAVKVIHNLPKDGPYQPSNDIKLKFYGLYKQATEGPCTISKPAFWDVVGRYKWEAWNNLGSMTKEEAMLQYVDGLKEIVETMAFDGNVQNFLEVVGPFYEFVNLQGSSMSGIKDTIDRLTSSCSSSSGSSPSNSCPESPVKELTKKLPTKEPDTGENATVQIDAFTASFHSNHNHQEHFVNSSADALLATNANDKKELLETSTKESSPSTSTNAKLVNGQFSNGRDEEHQIQLSEAIVASRTSADNVLTSGTESERYYSGDSEPELEDLRLKTNGILENQVEGRIFNSSRRQKQERLKTGHKVNFNLHSPRNSLSPGADVAIQAAVDRMNRDIDHILARLRILETAYASNALDSQQKTQVRQRFFGNLSSSSIAFIVLWPFVAHFVVKILSWWWRRKRLALKQP